MDRTALLIGVLIGLVAIIWPIVKLGRRHQKTRKPRDVESKDVYRRHGVTSAWQDDHFESS